MLPKLPSLGKKALPGPANATAAITRPDPVKLLRALDAGDTHLRIGAFDHPTEELVSAFATAYDSHAPKPYFQLHLCNIPNPRVLNGLLGVVVRDGDCLLDLQLDRCTLD